MTRCTKTLLEYQIGSCYNICMPMQRRILKSSCLLGSSMLRRQDCPPLIHYTGKGTIKIYAQNYLQAPAE